MTLGVPAAGTDYFGKHHSYLLAQDNYYTRKISNRLKEALDLVPGKEILELGCGAGRFSLPLLEQGLSLTCVDSSRELTEEFLKRVQNHHRVKVLTGDFFNLEGRYDFIIGFFVLHHFRDHGALFEKFRRLLKPGGRIGFIEPNPLNPMYYIGSFFYEGIANRDEYYFMVEKRRLSRGLEASGFRDVRIEKFGFFPPQILNLKAGPLLDRWTGWFVPRLCELIFART